MAVIDDVMQADGKRLYREYIEYFIKNPPPGGLGSDYLLLAGAFPKAMREDVEKYIRVVNGTLSFSAGFWSTSTVKEAFERIMGIASKTITNEKWQVAADFYKPENQTTALRLFKLATLNFANAAQKSRPQRNAMGVKIGLFG